MKPDKPCLALLFVLLALFVAAPRAADADCHFGHCAVNYAPTYQPYVQEAVVVTPVATLLVPSFSFQYLPAVAPAAVAPAVAVPAAAPAAPRAPAARPAAAPAAAVDDWPTAPTAAGEAAGIFQAHGCIGCHGEGGKNTPLFDASGQLLASADPAAILSQVEQNLMPPKARKNPSLAVSAEHKSQLRALLAR